MKKRLIAGMLAAAVLGAASTIPAQAACRGAGHCGKTGAVKVASPDRASARTAVQARSAGRRVAGQGVSAPRRLKASARATAALAFPSASQNEVVALITAMAPSHGVPTWFALRIAHVESNYRPHLRGRAGEYGVFQLKCATAKGIGFRGNCSALLDPRTNVDWGLRHLAIAIGKSGGNLKLAASKHNGGLGRKRLVPAYVDKVF